ncbi:MAG: single-stranded DNA-binding protein [Oscillospiraceae bacterium]|jgi:single-strand DNA-binding protein|nr:single-stranded DNA-binding protein [Oscillospiraceae bacterium]
MLNKVILMGRLTREPELRTTQSGVSVVSFTLAVERDFTARGEEKATDFIDIVAWRSTADFVSKYFRKGQLVAAEGRLQTRKWEDKEGNKRTSFEVVADNVYFAERKQEGYGAPPPQDAPPQRRPQRDSGGPPPFQLDAPATFAELDDDDGDLPF